MICPSEFWGFRHSIGLSPSVNAELDAPHELKYTDFPEISMIVSKNPNFKFRPSHEKQLQAMGFEWEYADSRDAAVTLLQNSEAHLFYIYGRFSGVSTNSTQYFHFSDVDANNSSVFTPGNILNKRIRWPYSWPLVFLNGSSTSALTPAPVNNFVNSFIDKANASGVIGTEISIFEPLATAFAEETIRRFMAERQTIGEAMRGVRLKLLKEGNPLGLVYTLYGNAGLRLIKQEAGENTSK